MSFKLLMFFVFSVWGCLLHVSFFHRTDVTCLISFQPLVLSAKQHTCVSW